MSPQAFKAGWASPVRKFALSPYPDNSTIRTDLLPPNSAQRVAIPSMHTTDNNFLWINVSALPDFKPSWPAWAAALPRANQLFVSYRVKQPQPGFDSGLVPELSNKVGGWNGCQGLCGSLASDVSRDVPVAPPKLCTSCGGSPARCLWTPKPSRAATCPTSHNYGC